MLDQEHQTVIWDQAIRAALLTYVASIPLSTIKLPYGFSLSFLLAAVFFALKAGRFLSHRRLMTEPEIITLCLLLAYLCVREVGVHGFSVDRTYFTTFGLNLLMCIMLIDEFKRDASAAKQAMATFVTVVSFTSAMLLLGIGSETSEAGRATILRINENELALSCVAAFTWAALLLIRQSKQTWAVQGLVYGATVVLILASISTGTRFMLVALIVNILILFLFLLLRSGRDWTRIAIASSWLLLVAVTTLSSQMMVERLDPGLGTSRPDSGGIVTLGGRVPLWQLALQSITQSPLFGLTLEGYKEFQLKSDRNFALPHNFVLEVAAIGGLVGLVILLVLLLQLGLRICRTERHGKPDIWLNALLLIVAASFVNIVAIKLVWFILAILVAIQPTSLARGQDPIAWYVRTLRA